jgi:hypothetical protein
MEKRFTVEQVLRFRALEAVVDNLYINIEKLHPFGHPLNSDYVIEGVKVNLSVSDGGLYNYKLGEEERKGCSYRRVVVEKLLSKIVPQYEGYAQELEVLYKECRDGVMDASGYSR